ncbi:unnamed protein product, partial [marine sediment metagenome]
GVFLILLTVLLYDRSRRGAWGWMIASWLTGLLAPFANEAGLTLAGLVVLYEWAAPHLRSRRHLPLALTYLLGPALYLAVWLSWRESTSFGLLENLTQVEQLLQKVAYFAQGTTFPLQFATARLAILWGWSGWWALRLGVALSLIVLGLFYTRLAWWRCLGLACGWVALMVLPPLVALSAGYVDTAPRLLYSASAGVACLWAGAVVGLQPSAKSRWTVPATRLQDRTLVSSRRGAPALRVVALALILVPSLVFLRQRVALHELV